MKKVLFTIAAVACLTACGLGVKGDRAKVTIKAVDEAGKPLSGVSVDARFLYGAERKGVTDSDGLFVLEGAAGGLETSYSLQNQGYYGSEGKIVLMAAVKGKLQPWNPVVTAVMKRMIKPIPMYAKIVEIKIPRPSESMGFDAMIGDRVQLLGQGVVSDFVFQVEGNWTDAGNYDETLTMSFANAMDGLVPVKYDVDNDMPTGSRLFMPREAPATGYLAEKKWRQALGTGRDKGYSPESQGSQFGRGYFFRIRSAVNEAGEITNAYYGKISTDIKFSGCADKPSPLAFTYYLNPTPNDRNMEFDPGKNLFPAEEGARPVTSP